MKLRKTGFQGGRPALIVDMMKYPEMKSIKKSKDISVSSAERLLLILHSLQSIIAVKMKRGISKEQACVLCAMDRTGNLITELICKGKMKHTDLERLFTGTNSYISY